MAAAGVWSSGAGLETVRFASPIPVEGRLELWIRDLDRQLVSLVVCDLDNAVKALIAHGHVGPGRPPLLHINSSGNRASDCTAIEGNGGDPGLSESTETGASQSRGNAGRGNATALTGQNKGLDATSPTRDILDGIGVARERTGPGNDGGTAGSMVKPSLQGHLLARSVHWTRLVEAALMQTFETGTPSIGSGGGSTVTTAIEGVHGALLIYLDGWATELRRSECLTPYASITNTALITQALQQRDVVEELLTEVSSSMRSASPSTGTEAEVGEGGSSGGAAGAPNARFGVPVGSQRVERDFAGTIDARTGSPASVSMPFSWTCHIRYYHVSPDDAMLRESSREILQSDAGDWPGANGAKGGRYRGWEDDTSEAAPPAPPPFLRVGLGPWSVPYGFEYAGTLERLWLTPLSERCLLHAAHSAKVSALHGDTHMVLSKLK